MSGAAELGRGRCAQCGQAAEMCADDGLWACSAEHLLLARILGRRETPERPAAVLATVSPQRLEGTRSAQREVAGAARAARRREVGFDRLRSLCEEADELLGQAAEAARLGEAGAAVEPLAAVRRLVAAILRALRRPVPAPCGTSGRQDALDEDRVLAALGLVEELDSQLRDARVGYRGAGWRAAELAGQLLGAVDGLTTAAASGRTRAHTSKAAENVA